MEQEQEKKKSSVWSCLSLILGFVIVFMVIVMAQTNKTFRWDSYVWGLIGLVLLYFGVTKIIKEFKVKEGEIEQVSRIVGFIVGIIAWKYLGILYFLIIVAGFLGWYLASLYSNKYKENGLTKFIAWINIITWFIPPVGLFTALASFKFNQVYGEKTKLYLILAIIGLVASVINGILGVIINL